MDFNLHRFVCPAYPGRYFMPRQLTFVTKRKKYTASPVKIDRRKLDGWTEIEAIDDAGQPCEVVNTDEIGRLIIARGGTAVGLLTSKGEWIERNDLKTVTQEGKAAKLLPSSFNTEIALRTKVTPQEYFNYNINDFYFLKDASEELLRAIGDEIYTFSYCYMEGCESFPAFILAANGELFLLVGQQLRLELIMLHQVKITTIC